MLFQLDHNDLNPATGNRQMVRAAAYFLLHAIGDLDEEGHVAATIQPTGPYAAAQPPKDTATPPAPPAPPPPPTQLVTQAPPAPNLTGELLPPPPPPTDTSNVVAFPSGGQVPPPPPVDTAATSGATGAQSTSPATTQGAATAAAVPGAASVQTSQELVDAAGMPWDERIHQSGKGIKKDKTWKLKKLFNSTPEKEAEFNALVQQVTREHAARKAGAAQPVTLPNTGEHGSQPPTPNTQSNSVPVPPVANGAAVAGVPAPNGGSTSVPVPPAPSNGAVAADPSPYRQLVDKITTHTKEGKIQAAKVMQICQNHGAPNLMALSTMQHLVPNISADIDAAALGLL